MHGNIQHLTVIAAKVIQTINLCFTGHDNASTVCTKSETKQDITAAQASFQHNLVMHLVYYLWLRSADSNTTDDFHSYHIWQLLGLLLLSLTANLYIICYKNSCFDRLFSAISTTTKKTQHLTLHTLPIQTICNQMLIMLKTSEHLPFTTSTTSQQGSILPMCLGWPDLDLSSKRRAVLDENKYCT